MNLIYGFLPDAQPHTSNEQLTWKFHRIPNWYRRLYLMNKKRDSIKITETLKPVGWKAWEKKPSISVYILDYIW